MSWQWTFHLIPALFHPPSPQISSSFLSPFVYDRLFLSPFNSHFLTPCTHSSILSSTSSPPSCFFFFIGARAGMLRTGWRLIGGWRFGRTPDPGTASQCGNVLLVQKFGFQGGCCPCRMSTIIPCVRFLSLCVSCMLLLYLNISETQIRWALQH